MMTFGNIFFKNEMKETCFSFVKFHWQHLNLEAPWKLHILLCIGLGNCIGKERV